MDAKTLNIEIGKRLGRDAQDVGVLCSQFSAVIGEALAQGDTISIPGFGSFESRKRNERVAIHPSTGKRILIPPKLTAVFRPSAMLKLKIRKP